MFSISSNLRRSALGLALAVLGTVAAPSSTAAQEDPAPRQAQADSAAMAADSMGLFMDMMGPTFGMMMEQMVEGLLRALERPATAERLATFTRNYYEALIARGFTDEQALRIVVAVGFPVMSGGS
jgi:hypothetical protein